MIIMRTLLILHWGHSYINSKSVATDCPLEAPFSMLFLRGSNSGPSMCKPDMITMKPQYMAIDWVWT